jgi:hypothetical protein
MTYVITSSHRYSPSYHREKTVNILSKIEKSHVNKTNLCLGPSQQAFIINAMEIMERKLALNNVACIQFRPRISSDQHYIRFNNGNGCSSPVIIFIIYNLSLISS